MSSVLYRICRAVGSKVNICDLKQVSPSCMSIRLQSSEGYQYETLKVTKPRDWVWQVNLNRPEKRNAMNITFWSEMRDCFQRLATESECRAIVLAAEGKLFSAGIDLMAFASLMPQDIDDVGRRGFKLYDSITTFQETFTVIEKCPKPVIAAVHNGCVGAAIDMISACDIRYATEDSWFTIKEVDVGLAADVGTLQRFPKIVGNDSLVRELAYTARRFDVQESKDMGFISRIFPSKEAVVAGALETASLIASKSPVSVQGTKIALVYSRDHSVPESLQQIAMWNQCMLQSEDTVRATMASIQKTEAEFEKL